MQDEIRELVASNGDVRLASERLHVPVHDLMSKVLATPELREAIMASISLQVLDLVSNFKVALIASLDEMSGRDIARSLVEILESFGNLEGKDAVPAQNPLQLLQVFGSDTASARERVFGKLASFESFTSRQVS